MLHLFTGSTQPNRGSDEFRLREAWRALRAQLDADGMLELNTTEVAARDATPARLIELASTVPFLASARVVAVEGLIAAAGTGRGVMETWGPLVEALPRLPETSRLVLLEPAREREQRQALARSPLLRALRGAEGADVREFAELSLGGRGGNEVARWLRERAGARGAALEPPAAARLSELIGADLWALDGELGKLAHWADGRPIAVADVELLTPAAREEDVFALVDDAVTGRTRQALTRLRRMLERGQDPPIRLQGLIARQLRHLVRAAALLEEGAPREAIAEATGVRHPFPLGKLADQAAAVGRPAAEDGLRAAEAADHAVKTGRGSDALALELLIVRLGTIGGSRGGRGAGGGRAGGGSRRARS